MSGPCIVRYSQPDEGDAERLMAAAYKIFLSSPSDVEDERLAVQRVVDQINAARAPDQATFELFRWEEQFYTADSTFQDQVVQPADCDLVICLFWKRLGSELPPHYQRPDGTTPTGTEFEFEQALAKATEAEPKTPDIFVYRKTAPVVFAEETMAIEVEQRQKLLAFWTRWFQSEQGHFTAAYQKFEKVSQLEDLIERNLLGWLEQREPRGDWRGGSPFPGLRAYDVGDGDIFFGRSRDVGRARARLFANAAGGASTLIISGASGTGKSSVLRAGLIASLIRPGGFAPHADIVRHVITTPASLATGDGWATSLASVLMASGPYGDALRQGDFDRPAALGAVLTLGGEAAITPLRKALERMKAAAPDGAEVAFLLAVDQFEEVFQLTPNDAEAFGALLNAMAGIVAEGARFVILGSMRSDHRHRFDEVASLALLSGRDQVRAPNAPERFFDLAPPRPADLREIITEPARIAGLTYEHDGETSLASVIEAEATGEALPALQLLLFSLYQDRADDELRFETFHRLGGVGGAMARTAEEAFQAVSAGAQGAFPRVMRALVAESAEGGGAVARWADADALTAEAPAAELVEALVSAHLLRSEDRKLRVAHESLLANWDRAADQIAADRRFFDIRSRLADRAARWGAADAGQARRMLLRDFDLEEGRALIGEWGEAQVAEAAPKAPAFISRSVDAARRRRFAAIGGVAAVLILLTAGAFAAWTYRTEAAAAAREAAIRLEVGRANEALRVGETDTALQAALRAVDLAETVETRSILAMAMNETSPHLAGALDAQASALSWERGGALSGIFGGRRWRAEPGQWAAQYGDEAGGGAPVLALASSPDGWIGVRADGSVASDQGDQRTDAAMFDLWRTSQIALTLRDAEATAYLADEVEGVWALRCSTPPSAPCAATQLPLRTATAIAFDEAGGRLIAAHQAEDGAHIASYDPDDGGERAAPVVVQDADEVLSLAVSPKGGGVALGARNGGLFLVTGGEDKPARIHSGENPVTALAWSPSGARFAANCGGGDICLFASDGALQARMAGGKGAIIWLGFSPDGAMIAALDDRDAVRIWTVAPNRAGASLFVGSDVAEHRLTALSSQAPLAGAYGDGAIRIWRAPDVPPAATLPIGSGSRRDINSVATSAAGDLAAVDADGGVAIWRAPADRRAPDVTVDGVAARRLAIRHDGRIVATTAEGGLIASAKGEARRIDGAGPSPDGVAVLPGGGFVISNTEAAFPLFDASGARAGALEAEIVDARLSASSLSAHPGGRWLAASRDDGVIRLFTLDPPTITVDLPILRKDSKFVAFSPDGAKLAALDSGGNLYVWAFDAGHGAAIPYLQLPALPERGAPQNEAREANGLAWLTPDCLAIGSQRRGIFQICHDLTALKARARRLVGR